ncbi:F-box family protein [Artemisia annua]|uniref:F-box family protein n=1 Tax=Artemisia annua TaxID=35608 RepID=A0A2U1QMU5_ARTAN|nr:F-box family protein [Artemisia annua]
MFLITSRFPNLTRLELRQCLEITDSGVSAFSKNCNKLKEFSCVDCAFSDLGIFELLRNCSQLEVLSVTSLYSLRDVRDPAKFRTGLPANTLKVIELRYVYSERLFEPLISGSKNLKSLKLYYCGGKWDSWLKMIPDDSGLVEVHLETVNVTDVGLSSLSKCRYLNSLRIVNINNQLCTNVGLISIAKNCKRLKKLYVGYWKYTSYIGEEGLIAVGEHSMNLEELILIGVNATHVSLEVIARNCQNLVRLELSMSETITDVEMSCIAEKCVALKSLCIEECCVSNKGIEEFALGCPNLAKIRDQTLNAITNDSRVQEHVEEVPPAAYDVGVTGPEPVSTSCTSSRNGDPSSKISNRVVFYPVGNDDPSCT